MRPIPRGQIAPSLLACDFSRLAEQVEMVMDAGAKVIHFDSMDGKFVPPITIGSIIAASISDLVHERGGILDCHLMVEHPERQVEMFAQAGADVITVHPEATPHIHYTLQMIREHGCNAGVGDQSGNADRGGRAGRRDHRPLPRHERQPGLGRADATSRPRPAAWPTLRGILPPEVVLEVDGGVSLQTIDEARDAGTDVFVAGSSVFGADDPAAAFGALQAGSEKASFLLYRNGSKNHLISTS